MKEAIYLRVQPLLERLTELLPLGSNVYDDDWEVLVVLDACRPDLLAELRDGVQTRWSIASSSRPWMERTFARSETAETVYVTGNPFSKFIDATAFETIDEVWRYAWNDDLGTIEPTPLTERAIHHYRTAEPERLIVHYMQPHWPFVPDRLGTGLTVSSFGESHADGVWNRLKRGELSESEVWAAYRANLEYVLDDVDRLLNAIDCDDVVITADHGNSFGGLGVYGHVSYVPLPGMRQVPWLETTGTNTSGHEPVPKSELQTDSDRERDELLRDLGYKQ